MTNGTEPVIADDWGEYTSLRDAVRAAEAVQAVGADNETLKQKASRIKVELELGAEFTTAGAILRAANEAMGLTANCFTLPQQASRLLAEIGI